MEEKYKKILPEDIFITIIKREPTEAELWMGASRECPGHRKSGNDFMDLFAGLVRRYRHQRPQFYAKRMGVTGMELNMAIHAMSGICATEWISRYLMLAAKEILVDTNYSISEIAGILKISQLSVFTKMFTERCKMPPSEYRLRNKKEKG